MNDNGPTEPAADLRVAAAALWGMFVALRSEGFSESQALVIIGHVLASQSSSE